MAIADLKQQYADVADRAWNHGELDRLDELFADDVVVHDGGSGETYDGLDAFKGWITDVRTALPDLEVRGLDGPMTEASFLIDDELVASQWVTTGTHDGPFPALGLEPTGRHVEFQGSTVYEMADGRVQEAWWYYDMLGFLQQLGVIPEEMTA